MTTRTIHCKWENLGLSQIILIIRELNWTFILYIINYYYKKWLNDFLINEKMIKQCECLIFIFNVNRFMIIITFLIAQKISCRKGWASKTRPQQQPESLGPTHYWVVSRDENMSGYSTGVYDLVYIRSRLG